MPVYLRISAGRFEEAISEYHAVLALDPRHAVAMSSLARAYRARGDNLNAEQWFRKCVVTISVYLFVRSRMC